MKCHLFYTDFFKFFFAKSFVKSDIIYSFYFQSIFDYYLRHLFVKILKITVRGNLIENIGCAANISIYK